MKGRIAQGVAWTGTVVLIAIAAVGLHAAIAVTHAHVRKLALPAPMSLRSIPTESESWKRFGADPPPLAAEIIETLGTENYVTRRYIRKDTINSRNPSVFELHCTYFTGMAETVPHVPETCFVGGGMKVRRQSRVVDVPLDLSRFPPDPTIDPAEFDPDEFGVIRRGRTGPLSPTPGVRVRMPFGLENLKLRVTEFESPEGARLIAGYFFLANGWAASDSMQVRLRAFDLKTDYAYFGKIQFTSALVDSPEELAALAADFLNEMLPDIMLRIPDWVEVARGEYPPDRSATPASPA